MRLIQAGADFHLAYAVLLGRCNFGARHHSYNMRVVGEIPHPEIKITLFHWNNRYLIKLEAGPFEQTFKVQEFDVASEEDLRQIVNETFLRQAIERFNDMAQSLQQATQFL